MLQRFTPFALALALCPAGCGISPPAPAAAPLGPALVHGIAQADSLVASAVGDGLAPGAVLLVARHGRPLHHRAYGFRQLFDAGGRLSEPPPMTTETIFDLASVTKVMATTMALMLLVDDGRVDLDAPVHRYLPDFRGARLDSIAIRHLLDHSSGLAQWQPLYYHAGTAQEAYARIRAMPLEWGVGEGRHYSDLGFMLLGYVVEEVSGERLDAFLRRRLYDPMGLRSIGFRPRAEAGVGPRGGVEVDFAATEHGNAYERRMVHDSAFGYRVPGDPHAWDGWRRHTLVGEVNDGNAWYAHGGIAGHAGLFSDAADLQALLDLLLNDGSYRGRRYLSAETVSAFLTLDDQGHFLGWMHPEWATPKAFAHGGFTGTWVMGVPEHGLSVVLLTNRQNAGTDARGFFSDLTRLQRAVARALGHALIS